MQVLQAIFEIKQGSSDGSAVQRYQSEVVGSQPQQKLISIVCSLFRFSTFGKMSTGFQWLGFST